MVHGVNGSKNVPNGDNEDEGQGETHEQRTNGGVGWIREQGD